MPFPRLRPLSIASVTAGVFALLTACSPVAGGTLQPSATATPSIGATAIPTVSPPPSAVVTPNPTPPWITPTPTPVPRTGLRIVALGDSVTSGYNCHCAAFPAEYAALLAARDSIRAQALNLGAPGLTTAGLLGQLTGSSAADKSVQAAVAAADIVVVTIGANNFNDHRDPITSGTCAGRQHTGCTRDELTIMAQTLSAAVDQLRILRAGAPVTIMLTGYWNVFSDGAVADRDFPAEGIAASVALTKEANARIRIDALAENAIYVDLWPVFEGADSDKDPTPLLASDGDHPNAAGHAAIAAQLLAATPRF